MLVEKELHQHIPVRQDVPGIDQSIHLVFCVPTCKEYSHFGTFNLSFNFGIS